MSITCEELAKLSLNLRVVSGRLMRSRLEDARGNLQRFLSFIDAAPLLKDLIDDSVASCSRQWDMNDVVSQIRLQNPYSLPTDEHEEIAFTYNLLKFILSERDTGSSATVIWTKAEAADVRGRIPSAGSSISIL